MWKEVARPGSSYHPGIYVEGSNKRRHPSVRIAAPLAENSTNLTNANQKFQLLD
jgi:hypothetical protein